MVVFFIALHTEFKANCIAFQTVLVTDFMVFQAVVKVETMEFIIGVIKFNIEFQTVFIIAETALNTVVVTDFILFHAVVIAFPIP